MLFGEPIQPFRIDWSLTTFTPLPPQQRPQSTISVCRSLPGDVAQLLQDLGILDRQAPAAIAPRSP